MQLFNFSSLDPEQVETLNIEDENFDELCQELKIILYVLDKNVKLGVYFWILSSQSHIFFILLYVV